MYHKKFGTFDRLVEQEIILAHAGGQELLCFGESSFGQCLQAPQ